MKSWSVYLIRCRHGRFYTGVTTDVARRLREHESGVRGARSLKGKGPLALAFCQEVGDRGRAQWIEYRLRRLPRSVKECLASGEVTLSELFPGESPRLPHA